MLKRVLLAVLVGIVAALVTLLVGHILVEVGVEQIGAFVKGVAVLVGLIAGVWYFLTGQTPSQAL